MSEHLEARHDAFLPKLRAKQYSSLPQCTSLLERSGILADPTVQARILQHGSCKHALTLFEDVLRVLFLIDLHKQQDTR